MGNFFKDLKKGFKKAGKSIGQVAKEVYSEGKSATTTVYKDVSSMVKDQQKAVNNLIPGALKAGEETLLGVSSNLALPLMIGVGLFGAILLLKK